MSRPDRKNLHRDLAALLPSEDEEVQLLDDSVDVDALRAEFSQTMSALDGPKPAIASINDLEIEANGTTLRLRVYDPREQAVSNAPVIAFFHGGGFMQGDLDSHDSICRHLAVSADAVVISVDYRRSPEHEYPTAHEDCAAAVAWIAQSAEQFKVDLNTLCLAGDSAGAAIAAGLISSGKIKTAAFQMLFYPSTNHVSSDTESHALFGKGYWLDNAPFYIRKYFSDPITRADVMASPAQAQSLAHLPPTYLCTIGFDPLRDEGRAFASRIASEGGNIVFEEYENMLHGFLNCRGIVNEAELCITRAASAYKAALKRLN